jgi:hypothetical protein
MVAGSPCLSRVLETDDVVNYRLVVNAVREKLYECDGISWYQKLWNDINKPNGNKLRTYRTYKSELVVEPYLLLNHSVYQRRSPSRLRIGVLPLEIETGRHCRPSIPVNERYCTLCNHHVCETELHFLMSCPLYDDQRQFMLEYVLNTEPNFNALSTEEKFVYLMSEPQVQGCLIKTVNNMFNRRQLFKTK